MQKANENFNVNVVKLCETIGSIIEPLYLSKQTTIDPEMFKTLANMIPAYKLLIMFDRSKEFEIILKYITNTHMHWDKIKNRDEKFFIDNMLDIFRDMPIEVDFTAFKMLVTNNLLSADDKNDIWDYFYALTYAGIAFLYFYWNPIKDDSGNVTFNSQNINTELKDIDLLYFVKLYGVKV